METTKQKTAKKTTEKKEQQPKKKYSKTWLSALKNVGTGEILDMKAVLK
ncbi:MAG: hypothetical protein QM564_00470 [Bergeyella sp.]